MPELADSPLLIEARRFADELTGTVNGVVAADCAPFHATVFPAGERISVRQEPASGIPLTVDGAPLLTLVVTYRCTWDTTRAFMAVEDSEFKVYAGAQAKGEPLLRYDFVGSPTPGVPGAHVQVHGHRDELTYVMTRAGHGSSRGSRRATQTERGEAAPRMSDLHLPVGGMRFRPCLEDVLEVLVHELGVDHKDSWQHVLQLGRERWRRLQTRTAVRDAPSEAVAALQQLGYEVTWPGEDPQPGDKVNRLREL